MQKLKLIGAILVTILLFIRPQAAVAGAQSAMGVWYSSVVPSLFPFLVLMPLLTGGEACKTYEAMFSRWMKPIFRLPGSAVPAVIAGLIAGSPGGAIALRKVTANSKLNASQAKRIAFALGGVSPAYLIFGVGERLYGSIQYGIRLAMMQATIQLLLLIILPSEEKGQGNLNVEFREKNEKPIRDAMETLLGICGYMMFFSVIAASVAALIGEKLGGALLALMDLPSGLAYMAGSNIPMKKIIQSAAIGFSGLCIISQNLDVLKEIGIEWKKYIGIRGVSAALFALFGGLIEMKEEWVFAKGFANVRETYAFALLIAIIVAVPCVFSISKNLFLNIREPMKIEAKKCENINI